MKSLLIITFLFFAIACRKGKIKEDNDSYDHLHVSYDIKGISFNMQPPMYSYGYSSSSGNGVFFTFFKDSPNLPGNDLQFIFQLRGRMETKSYTIPRNKTSPILLTFTDTSQAEYTMETGTFSLSKIDSLNTVYKGTFEGVFINDSETDSFVLNKGDFYFQMR